MVGRIYMTFLACLEFFHVEMPKGVKNWVVGHLAGRVTEAPIGDKMYPDWRIRSLVLEERKSARMADVIKK